MDIHSNKVSIKLRLLTYNIFMRPPLINEKGKSDHKNERLKMISKEILPKYDIICFQELFSTFNTRQRQMAKSGAYFGIKYASKPPDPLLFTSLKTNSGLLSLSRFKIAKTEFYEFRNCSGVDALAQKGVLYSLIEIAGKKLHLFNTHLQATYPDTNLTGQINDKSGQKKNFVSRLQQMIELRNFISKILGLNFFEECSEDLVLLCGDFNTMASRLIPKKFLLETQIKEEAKIWIEAQPGTKFDEYSFLFIVLQNFGSNDVVDLVRKSFDGRHPTTSVNGIGNGKLKIEEIEKFENEILEGEPGIDYWFQLVNKNSQEHCNLESDVLVRPFLVKNDRFDRLSDHFGVELNLDFCF